MNLNDFPVLSENQVALVRSEKSTGIILDEKFERHISDQQILYSIFDNYDLALGYVKENAERGSEFILYGKNQEVLLYQP